MEQTRDSSPALSDRASMLHRITKGDLMPLQAQQQQLQSPNVVPAPTVERREEGPSSLHPGEAVPVVVPGEPRE
eukprot:12892862-Prorocentrum_lima.AAC.1